MWNGSTKVSTGRVPFGIGSATWVALGIRLELVEMRDAHLREVVDHLAGIDVDGVEHEARDQVADQGRHTPSHLHEKLYRLNHERIQEEVL